MNSIVEHKTALPATGGGLDRVAVGIARDPRRVAQGGRDPQVRTSDGEGKCPLH